jgi:hypothetical protein
MARYHGRKGVVYLKGSGAVVRITTLTDWSLDASRDKVDVTAFGDTNLVSVQGLPNYTGDFNGFWDDTQDTIFEASENSAAGLMYLYPSADAPTKYWCGPAWVDYSINTAVKDAVKVKGTWSAGGAWTRVSA